MTADCLSLLCFEFQEYSPHDFYRELFPEGSLQASRPGKKGEYPAVAIQIKESGNLRHTVLDDLAVVAELCACDDFCVMSPVTYAGASQRKSMAHALYAVVIDLDGLKERNGEPKGLHALLTMTSKGGAIPRPTFVVASGTGVHLYYMLDVPYLMTPESMDALAEMRRTLTRMIWNPQVTSLSRSIQYEGVTQGFRMVGTITKAGGRVRAFKTGDRVSMAYLASFTRGLRLLRPRSRKDVVPMDVAREKWPDWYQKRIVQGVPRGTWRSKRDLYEWWKRRVAEEGSYGHRYNCIVALAAYARKCGVSSEELKRDALALRDVMNSKPCDDELTEKDVRDALTAYRAGMVTYPIDEIVERTGIKIEKNKRNGRSQADHLRRARAVQMVDYPNREWINKKGAPKKCVLVRDYAYDHPGANHSEIAKALGVSRTTVVKWLKPGWYFEHKEFVNKRYKEEEFQRWNAETDDYFDAHTAAILANRNKEWMEVREGGVPATIEWARREIPGLFGKLQDARRAGTEITDDLIDEWLSEFPPVQPNTND